VTGAVTGALLLDTHIALWLESGDERLRSDDARLDRRLLGGRWNDLRQRRDRLGDRPARGCRPHRPRRRRHALGGTLPGQARGDRCSPDLARGRRRLWLGSFAHRDPADRLLIVTAIELDCPLVTYDEQITAFATRHGRRYGFAAVRG